MSKIEVSKMPIRPEAEQILHFSAVTYNFIIAVNPFWSKP